MFGCLHPPTLKLGSETAVPSIKSPWLGSGQILQNQMLVQCAQFHQGKGAKPFQVLTGTVTQIHGHTMILS